MSYILFTGLVLAAAAMSRTAAMGNAIILAAVLTAAITSATTTLASKLLGSTSTLSECLRSNFSALVGAGLVFVFAFQVASKAPFVFLASPILAILIAAVVFSQGLALPFARAIGVTVLSALAAYAVAASVGKSINFVGS